MATVLPVFKRAREALNSLAARVLLILVLAMLAIQALSFGGVLVGSARESRERMYAYMAKDLHFVQQFLRSLPHEQRAPWLQKLDRGYYAFQLRDASEAPRILTDQTLVRVAQAVEDQFSVAPAVAGALEGLKIPGLKSNRVLPVVSSLPDAEVCPAIALGIDEGQRLEVLFLDREPPFGPPPMGVILAYLALVTGAVLAVSWLAVRLATRPLQKAAQAAQTLASNLEAPPLPERGPSEVSALAQAFNGMQKAIRSHLNERTQILSAISHDLKTPLTRMKLRISTLPESEARDKLEADVTTMESLIQEGLDYAHSATLSEPRVALDLNSFLESMAEEASDVGHTVGLSGQLAKPVDCAPRALQRVIQNLLDNALKYGQAPVQLSVRIIDDHPEIWVEDHGPGLPPELLTRVFDPFYRAEHSRNRETGGSGLGLAIAQNLIRAQGGQIVLENRAEGGLRARVVIGA